MTMMETNWKPTKQQIFILLRAIKHTLPGSIDNKQLTSLYNDLKKIMMEQVKHTIISAEEANELTDRQIQKDDSDLFPIMELIHKAISRKEYYCHYTGILKDYTIEKLHKLGYKLEHFNGGGNQREPDYYKISWEH